MSASSWIAAFEERNGRRPRVLHIGNIANNAYLNASILNAVGIDCDVLCYDCYHVMACPEWESAVFEPESVDQFRPRWSEVDVQGFERPRWFVQGPLNTCLDYLIARRSGNNADELWRQLAREREDPPGRPRRLAQLRRDPMEESLPSLPHIRAMRGFSADTRVATKAQLTSCA